MKILSFPILTKGWGRGYTFNTTTVLTETTQFFEESGPEQIVFKKEDYFEKIDEEHHAKIEWVIPNAQKNSMEPIRLTLKPGGASEELYPHEGEEFGYVLKGAVKLTFGAQKYTLHAGESFAFPSTKKHRLENPGRHDAVVLWITTPPSF